MPDFTLTQLQDEIAPWTEHNFPGEQPVESLLSAIEEIGELAHAHLSSIQGIRGTETEHTTAAKDAVGDVVIALAHYCNTRGFDMAQLVERTWTKVRQRDYTTDPQRVGEGRPDGQS